MELVWLVIVTVLIVRARYRRSIILTKLTLVPLQLVILYLIFTFIQAVISLISHQYEMLVGLPFILVFCLMESLKTFSASLVMEV